MDSFLGTLVAAGRHDSQGAFTVDYSKAIAKLAQYRLASFQELGFHILAAASLCGAEELQIEVVREGNFFTGEKVKTLIRFLGYVMSPEELQRVGFSALKKDEAPHLKALAVVLSTLSARGDVYLVSAAEKHEVQLRVSLGQDKIAEAETRYCVLSRSTVLELDGDVAKEMQGIFYTRARFCQARVMVKLLDGDPLYYRQGFSGGPEFPGALAVLFQPDGFPLPICDMTESLTKRTLRQSAADGLPKFLVLKDDTPQGTGIGLWVSVRGLTFPLQFEGSSNLLRVVFADHLALDISLQNVVQNQDYLSLVDEIRCSLPSMLEKALLAQEKYPPQKEMLFHKLLLSLRRLTDTEPLFDLLEERSETIVATRDGKRLEALCARLPYLSPDSLDKLFASYQDVQVLFWRKGDEQALDSHLDAEIRLRGLAGQSCEQAQAIRYLRHLTKESRPPVWFPPNLQGYLEFLRQWQMRGTTLREGLGRHFQCHPSWLLPALSTDSLYREVPLSVWEEICRDAPFWVSLWSKIATGHTDEAITMARKDQRVLGERSAWLRLLWDNFAGKVDWLTAVGLRAELSGALIEKGAQGRRGRGHPFRFLFSNSGLPSDEQALSFAADLYFSKFESAEFWPTFLNLWLRQERMSAKSLASELWMRLVCRRLTGRLLEREQDPLRLPLW